MERVAAAETEQAGMSFAGKEVLRDVSLKLQPGSFTLLFGPNGAGKTTLLRIMAGLEGGYRGSVRIAGREVKGANLRTLARLRAYLGQSDEFELPLTVQEILESGRFAYRPMLAGMSESDRACVARAVERFSLQPLMLRDIRNLSGGERKRALIASALVQEVELILLDEPLNFLDPGAARSVLLLLAQLQREGKTIVVVSHSLELFFPYADSLAALKNGKLLYFGKADFLPELFAEVYGVSYRRISDGGRSLLFWHEK